MITVVELFIILEDKMPKNIVNETNAEELRFFVNIQKNIEQKLSSLNDKNDLIKYIELCKQNIDELILISTSFIQEGNNNQIQNIINDSLDQIYLFILDYTNNHIDEVYSKNNLDVTHKVDQIYTSLLYYFENDIIFDNIEGDEYYIKCFNIYIYLLQIGYLLTKKECYLSICTDFSNI